MSLPMRNNYLHIPSFDREGYLNTLNLLREANINTVCIEANCPNRYECFSHKRAAFMILGKTCTRACRYCNVKHGKPEMVDDDEPERIAEAVKKLNIEYVVITSVTRDDLVDGGAFHFVRTVNAIRQKTSAKIELLIPDFSGNMEALNKVINAKPIIINHNIETVERLFNLLRQGNYQLSLKILNIISKKVIAKSGFMVGLGETKEEIKQTLRDLKKVNCKIVTIGQYLSPSEKHFPVMKYYTDEEFKAIADFGKSLGLKVYAGKLVRSSYNADKIAEGY